MIDIHSDREWHTHACALVQSSRVGRTWTEQPNTACRPHTVLTGSRCMADGMGQVGEHGIDCKGNLQEK